MLLHFCNKLLIVTVFTFFCNFTWALEIQFDSQLSENEKSWAVNLFSDAITALKVPDNVQNQLGLSFLINPLDIENGYGYKTNEIYSSAQVVGKPDAVVPIIHEFGHHIFYHFSQSYSCDNFLRKYFDIKKAYDLNVNLSLQVNREGITQEARTAIIQQIRKIHDEQNGFLDFNPRLLDIWSELFADLVAVIFRNNPNAIFQSLGSDLGYQDRSFSYYGPTTNPFEEVHNYFGIAVRNWIWDAYKNDQERTPFKFLLAVYQGLVINMNSQNYYLELNWESEIRSRYAHDLINHIDRSLKSTETNNCFQESH